MFSLLRMKWQMVQRFTDQSDVRDFLEKSKGGEAEKEYNPLQLKDLEKALARIVSAIADKERIMVFGDFDADGVTATVILVDALRRLGANVSFRIPERAVDSHGLKKHLIKEILETRTTLMITVDCGINEATNVAYAAERNLDVIVTDHHQVDLARFPTQAVAVINPHQADCSYPTKNLSGAGVAFKLVQALASHYFSEEEARAFTQKYLDVLAIGMIADCMALTGEVRFLVKRGLQQMPQTAWPGLEKLLRALKIELLSINEDTVGFYLGPVVNAASRLGDVNQAVQLFLSSNNLQSKVDYLLELNDKRRQCSAQATAEAQEQIDGTQKYQLIITQDWPVGVLGLVGGRICESLRQPVIVIREEGQIYKASCRSPQWANIEKALRAKSEIFHYVGGHPAAAGFSMPKENLALLKNHLKSYYDQLEVPSIEPQSAYCLAPEIINLELVDLVESYAPYGFGLPAPKWCLENAKIIEVRWIGAEQSHARLHIKAEDQDFTAMMFRALDYKEVLITGKTLDICFTLRRQVWRGQEQLQLMVVDLVDQ